MQPESNEQPAAAPAPVTTPTPETVEPVDNPTTPLGETVTPNPATPLPTPVTASTTESLPEADPVPVVTPQATAVMTTKSAKAKMIPIILAGLAIVLLLLGVLALTRL